MKTPPLSMQLIQARDPKSKISSESRNFNSFSASNKTLGALGALTSGLFPWENMDHCERFYLPLPTYPIKYLIRLFFKASLIMGLRSLSAPSHPTFLLHCLLTLIILQNRDFDATYKQSRSYYLLASLGLTSVIFPCSYHCLNINIDYVFVCFLSLPSLE